MEISSHLNYRYNGRRNSMFHKDLYLNERLMREERLFLSADKNVRNIYKRLSILPKVYWKSNEVLLFCDKLKKIEKKLEEARNIIEYGSKKDLTENNVTHNLLKKINTEVVYLMEQAMEIL